MNAARAELAVREGCTVPPGLPRGDIHLRRIGYADDPDAEIFIDHADPRILISAELLHQIAAEPTPHVFLDSRHLPERDPGAGCPELFVGTLLKIRAVNRNVIYRITESVFEVDAYIGEWPG